MGILLCPIPITTHHKKIPIPPSPKPKLLLTTLPHYPHPLISSTKKIDLAPILRIPESHPNPPETHRPVRRRSGSAPTQRPRGISQIARSQDQLGRIPVLPRPPLISCAESASARLSPPPSRATAHSGRGGNGFSTSAALPGRRKLLPGCLSARELFEARH